MKPFNIKCLQICKTRLQRLIANIISRLQVCKPLYMPLQIANIISRLKQHTEKDKENPNWVFLT